MFGLPILEVAIGICFVYLLLALICSTVNEAIAGITRRRAKLLEKGIRNLLGDDTRLKEKLYAHPLIESLSPSDGKTPSYIPASKFALALMDVVTGEGKSADDAVALRAAPGVDAGGKNEFRKALTTILADKRAHLSSDQAKIEAWYDDAMARVSGWYKRHTLIWIWVLAAIVTLGLDADTLQIFRLLWVNQGVRSAVVESAKARAQGPRPEELMPLAEYTDADHPEQAVAVAPQSNAVLTNEERAELSQLTSWRTDATEWKRLWRGKQGWELFLSAILKLLGLIFTVAAISLGAPFWFDTLNKIMNVRASGKPPDASAAKSNAQAAPAGAQG